MRPLSNPNQMATPMILAGGLGTRLRAVTGELPKPLAPINGRPFLSYLFDQLIDSGFDHAVLCTGYRGEAIEATFGEHYRDLALSYSREPEPRGTAGALRLALPLRRAQTLLIMNGDSYCGIGLPGFLHWYWAGNRPAGMVLVEVDDCARYGQVEMDGESRITAFREKQGRTGAGLINAGICLLAAPVLEALPEREPVSLEHRVIPDLLHSGLFGYMSRAPFIDIGTPDSYAAADAFFAART